MSKPKEQKSSGTPFSMIFLLLIALAILGTGIYMLVKQGADASKTPETPTLEMMVGKTLTLESIVGSEFEVTVFDEKIAAVDASHVITALSTGTTMISASNGTQTQTFKLTVAANGTLTQMEPVTTPAVTEPPIEETTTTTAAFTTHEGCVTEIKLTFYSISMKVGDKKMPIVTMYPRTASNKKEDWTSSDESVATVDWLGNITAVGGGTCTIRVTSVDNPAVFAEVAVTVAGDTKTTAPAASTSTTTTTATAGGVTPTASNSGTEIKDGITYVKGIMIANKSYALPDSYNPGVDKTAKAAFDEMAAAAKAGGLSLSICSGFRSYSHQESLYNTYVQRDGKSAADTCSARPGHSEHQTGLAFDINKANDSFANTPEAKWLASHCWEYGFIIRYPKGKEQITGYKYEPWHIRYLGKETAKAVYDSGKTLEEYLGIKSVYAS